MLRLLLMVCALVLLDLKEAMPQSTPIAWPPLSGVSGSPLYAASRSGPLVRRPVIGEPSDTVVRQIRATYWKEGGAVGGVAGGIFLAYLMYGLCGLDGPPTSCSGLLLGGGLIGGGAGFVLGALIGGQFPKHPRKAVTDSAQVR